MNIESGCFALYNICSREVVSTNRECSVNTFPGINEHSPTSDVSNFMNSWDEIGGNGTCRTCRPRVTLLSLTPPPKAWIFCGSSGVNRKLLRLDNISRQRLDISTSVRNARARASVGITYKIETGERMSMVNVQCSRVDAKFKCQGLKLAQWHKRHTAPHWLQPRQEAHPGAPALENDWLNKRTSLC